MGHCDCADTAPPRRVWSILVIVANSTGWIPGAPLGGLVLPRGSFQGTGNVNNGVQSSLLTNANDIHQFRYFELLDHLNTSFPHIAG